MALIKKKNEITTVKKGVVFEEEIFNTLDAYVNFLEMPLTDDSRNYVVGEALKLLFNKDKEFRKTLKDDKKAEG